MVLSRALSLAAVTLLFGSCVVGRVEAQENLDAGKSPSQLFSAACTACHKSPRGLLKTVAPGSLQGFLRQHYTTSPEMAGVLASYLMSNGATDTRYGDKPKGGKAGRDARSEAQPEASPEEAGTEAEHSAHARRRVARPAESPEAAKPVSEGQQAASEHGADGPKTKRRMSKRGKPGVEEEAPKASESEPDESKAATDHGADAAPEPAKEQVTDTARVEPPKPAEPAESAKSAETAAPVERTKPAETTAQSTDADAPTGSVNEALPPSLRPDPVHAKRPRAAPVTSVAPAAE
jgi:hypothetical protein